MKKSSLILLIVLSFFIITGCSKSESNKEKVVSNGDTVNTSQMKHKHCTRSAEADGLTSVDLSYDLYYTGEDLNILHSVEKIVASDESTLKTYEDSYKAIHKHYEGLEYYDTVVTRGDTSVTSDITINYDKIDIDELLRIEGEEDNIIENGKAKVDKWITLAKKFGTSCEDVED